MLISCGCFVLLLGKSSSILAQNAAFPAPVVSGILGQKDAIALAEVSAFVRASMATDWQGLSGSGTVTFPAGDSHSAELHLSGAQDFRLDISMDSGTRSLRGNASSAKFLDERGNQGTLLPETGSRGIFAFPRVWATAANSSQLSLRDQGSFSGAGQLLHRITIEFAIAQPSQGPVPTVATDLYFDPTTHILVFSVEDLRFKESPNRLYRRVTHYSNYQQLGGINIPATTQQFINGQMQWTLVLNQVTTNTNQPESTFTF